MKELRFRQVHLDFHTSPLIPGIGKKFDKKQWQERLTKAHVDSITCFSSCHHGWSYHPTQVGKMHPHLDFNLLRAQIDASHEIDVNVPVYLTGGVNNLAADEHPEWRAIDKDGKYAGWTAGPLTPGFKTLCFNSPYLDHLCRMLEEAVTLFPDANGIFIDIISQQQCCCVCCMADMKKEGYNPENEDDRKRFARRSLMKYYRKSAEAVRSKNPDMPIFHNSGHVTIGDREILPYFSHLELESLPTGGWGYDHYPMSAAYCRNLEHDFLGMTGKFHTTWGEFGGFKHPNALRYECAAMLAQGSKCSIGDQLHPSGELDESTYELIGAAYSEVEAKEAWCGNVESTANVGVLSSQGSDVGTSRFLLENHVFFDLLDREMSFDRYNILILADDVRVDGALKQRLGEFLSRGGKLILSGTSGMWTERDEFAFDIGGTFDGTSPFCPDYVMANEKFAPDFVKTPFVMYRSSQRVKAVEGISLGTVYDPYFNRNYDHFSSHQHTPYKTEASSYDAGIMNKQILYYAHPVFKLYGAYGTVALKEYISKAFMAFCGEQLPIHTNLPSQGRATLLKQKEENRYILHLLYANTILRGSNLQMSGGNVSNSSPVEVIEELNVFNDVCASLIIPEKVKKITLEPQGVELPFEENNGRYEIKVDSLICHQMVVFHC